MLKRKIIPAFLASVLAISATAGVSAEVFSENAYAAEELHTVRLVDYAGLLEDDEAETLEEKLGTKLVISDKAQLCGALGAALFAADMADA